MSILDEMFGPPEIECVTWNNPKFKKRLILECFFCLLMIPIVIWISFCSEKQLIGFFPYLIYAFILSMIRSFVIDLARRPELKKIFNLDFSSFKSGGRFY